jgi:transposase
MPKLLFALPARDADEEHRIRKLANSRHAPADWIRRAQMIVLSWQRLRTTTIASQLHCHPQTVRERISRFNAEGFDGLGDLPGGGRKPRLTEQECSVIIALVATTPPGRLARQHDGTLAAQDEHKDANWTLDTLTMAVRDLGITVGRSQVRRILLAEGVPWRRTHSWIYSTDVDFIPKGVPSSPSIQPHLRARRPSV